MRKQLIISYLFFFVITSLMAQDVVQWRGENRDGIYFETGLLKQWPDDGPELLWHFDELGDGHASATVLKDVIYTAGTVDGRAFVYALDHSGNLLWKKDIGKSWIESWEGVRSTPLFYDGKLYIMTAFGRLSCLDASNGDEAWNIELMKDYDGRNIKWGFTENLLIDDDVLFVTPGGIDANIIALNKDTGKLIWKSKGNEEVTAYGSPAIFDMDGRKLLVVMTMGSIMGIDASDGKILWLFEHTNRWSVHPNTPLLHDGYLYCVSGYGKGGVKLKLSDDGSEVTEVWQDDNLDNQMGGVILLNEKLYGAGHNNAKYWVIDWNTGEVLSSNMDMKRGNTTFADGMLYFYDERGWVGLVKPEGDHAELISSFRVPYGEKQHWAHLVINDKKLYVRHGTSLMVYDISAD